MHQWRYVSDELGGLPERGGDGQQRYFTDKP